jgi:hypothetical protein
MLRLLNIYQAKYCVYQPVDADARTLLFFKLIYMKYYIVIIVKYKTPEN